MADLFFDITATGDGSGSSYDNAKLYSDTDFQTAAGAWSAGDGIYFVTDGTDIFDVSVQITLLAVSTNANRCGVYGVDRSTGLASDDIRAYLRWTGAASTDMFINNSAYIDFWGMKAANVDADVFGLGKTGYSLYNCEFDNITGNVLAGIHTNVCINNIIATNCDIYILAFVNHGIVANSSFLLGAQSCIGCSAPPSFHSCIIHDFVNLGIYNAGSLSEMVIDECDGTAVHVKGNFVLAIKHSRLTNNLKAIDSISYPSVIENVRYKDNGTDVVTPGSAADSLLEINTGQISGDAYRDIDNHDFRPPLDDPYTAIESPIGARDEDTNIAFRTAGIQVEPATGGGRIPRARSHGV